MEIIDAHAHIGHKIIVADADQLVASMNASGISHAMVIAGRMFDCATEVLLEDIAAHRNRLHPIGAVAPLADPPEQALAKLESYLANKQLAAVKFYTGYQHFFPHDSAARPYLELCAQYGVPAVFHTGDCYCKIGDARLKYAQPMHLDELAVDMPKLTIIMAHMGNPWIVDGKQVCYKNPNVYADCSGFVCGAFDDEGRASYVAQVREFLRYVENPEKLLFGTDWPICEQQSYVDATLEALDGKGPKTTELVMGGNARRLYGIPTG